MKVPITLHRLENHYNAPPPIAITGNRLTPDCIFEIDGHAGKNELDDDFLEVRIRFADDLIFEP